MGNHTLSVIMPNYNDSCYISEALEAILNQSFRPMEVIVVDDGSTDNSVEIIEQFAKRYPIIRLLKNERNMGIYFSVNRALECVSGDYLYFPSANDRVLPGFFEKFMNMLNIYPQAGLCSVRMMGVDEHGNVLGEIRKKVVSRKACYMSPASVLTKLQRNPYYLMMSLIYKTSALRELGPFIPELRIHAEWFFVCAIALKYGACYIPEALVQFRYQRNQYHQSIFRQTSLMVDSFAHILYLMTETKYRERFPDGFANLMRRTYVKRLGMLERSLLAQLYDSQFAFTEAVDRLKVRPMVMDRLIRYCLKQIARVQRYLALWYCHRDFGSELDEAVNRLRSASN